LYFLSNQLNQNEVIGLVVSSSTNGLYDSQTIYTINIDFGDISEEWQEFDNNIGM
jgi:hypothetical protein